MVAIVYASGGAVVFGCLQVRGFGAVAPVATLPRELLISIGLLTVVLPSLIVSLLYMVVWILSRDQPPRKETGWRRHMGAAMDRFREPRRFALVWGALLLAVAGVVWLLGEKKWTVFASLGCAVPHATDVRHGALR